MSEYAVVYLNHPVRAFSLSDQQFASLRLRFPTWSFVRVTSEEELMHHLASATILLSWHMRKQWYALAPRLRLIATPAAGHDWIEDDPNRMVTVIHGSYHGAIMAESLIAMMLFFSRRLGSLLDNQRSHAWERDFLSTTRRIGASTVMIVGYGHIGRHCARLLKGFGCRITGVKRGKRDRLLDRDADTITTFEECRQLIGDVDHVVAILPATPQTQYMLDDSFFKAMRPDAYFYNLGRANCYQEHILVRALQSGLIEGAGLDVFQQEPLAPDSPLWDMHNVLIMPHASAISGEYLWMWLDELEEKLATE
ncbi:MAG: D-2-hydroxyacid dehydrogenase [Chitinispirillaceae bacterium]